MKKMIIGTCLAAFVFVTTFSAPAQAIEMKAKTRMVTEGPRGGSSHGRGGRGGRGHHGGGSGWGWAALGAVVGLGVLAATTSKKSDKVYYATPGTTYVYPGTTTYYTTPGTGGTYYAPSATATYADPNAYYGTTSGVATYADPNAYYGGTTYGTAGTQTYATPGATTYSSPTYSIGADGQVYYYTN